jgi:membrane protease YdiL (CAAX protease family)
MHTGEPHAASDDGDAGRPGQEFSQPGKFCVDRPIAEAHRSECSDCLPDAPPAPPNYCHTCGTPWNVDWTGCPVCEKKRQAAARAPAVRGSPSSQLVSAITLYFICLLSGLAIGFLLPLALLDRSEVQIVALSMLVDCAVFSLIVLAWTLAWWNRLYPALSGLPGPFWYGIAIGAAGITFLLATYACGTLEESFGIERLGLASPLLASGYGWPVVITVICLQPAIIEELAFRGIIFRGLQQVLTEREVIIVSSLMFMVIHLAVPSFPHLLIIGLALGYLRWRTGSLYPGMLLHFTHNLLTVLTEPTGA